MTTRAERKTRARRRRCPKCGQYKARHYVPASFGDPGFYICEALGQALKNMRQKAAGADLSDVQPSGVVLGASKGEA